MCKDPTRPWSFGSSWFQLQIHTSNRVFMTRIGQTVNDRCLTELRKRIREEVSSFPHLCQCRHFDDDRTYESNVEKESRSSVEAIQMDLLCL